MEKRLRSAGTHDGTFHADEVTACALLILCGLVDRDKIIRTRDPQELAVCEFVCDVGGQYDPGQKLFDHHQVEYQGDLSSAGMVLRYLKQTGYLSEGLFNYLNSTLVLGVDAHDNGRGPQEIGYCSFSNVVSNFTPFKYNSSAAEQNHAFNEALEFVLGHLSRMKKRYEYICSCREAVADTMEKCRECLIFDEAMPWIELFFDMGGEEHPAVFVIMPSGEHWKLRGVPPSLEEKMKVRIPFPAEWAGLCGEELKHVTGIPGSIFCHKGRFISVWETKEDALKAFEYILPMVKEQA